MADNDDILGDESPKTSPVDKPSDGDIKGMVQSELAQHSATLGSQLDNVTQQIVQGVSQALNQFQAGQALKGDDSPADDGEDWQKLAADPRTYIGKVVQDTMRSTLGPYLATQADDKYGTLMDDHKSKFDREFGDGKFDLEIQPQVDMILQAAADGGAQLKSSAQHINILIESIRGKPGMFDKLTQLKADKAKLDQEASDTMNPSPPMLGNASPPRRRSANQLTPDDKEWMEEYFRETGMEMDHKYMEEVLKARSDGGWQISNFPGLADHAYSQDSQTRKGR